MYKPPYHVVAGQGLGVSYSSLTQLGNVLPASSYGQAGIEVYANIANGNLHVRDRVVKTQEMNGDLAFYYCYNSQASTAADIWRFSFQKAFKQLPQLPGPVGDAALLVEPDGHETQYRRIAYNFYTAEGHAEGSPYLRYDEGLNQWVCFNPKTQLSEYYDLKGRLLKQQDTKGRATTFKYNNDQLEAVTGPSGQKYEIRRVSSDVYIYVIHDGKEEVLQCYHFDEKGRLAFSQSPSDYRTSYDYSNDTRLKEIRQTDGSSLKFNYKIVSAAHNYWLTDIVLGSEGFPHARINYDQQPVVVIQDGVCKSQLTLDTQGHITQVECIGGYSPGKRYEMNVTAYTYNTDGLIDTITHPDKSQEKFSYDPVFKMRIEHQQPNDKKIKYIYGANPDQDVLCCKVDYQQGQAATTRYFYDKVYTQGLRTHLFLRFVLSPEGQVTEYRPDQGDNVASVRTYLAAKFDISKLLPEEMPPMHYIEEWVAKQPAQHISLTEFHYNMLGQVTVKRSYASIASDGTGIEEAAMSEEMYSPDRFGNIERYKERQVNEVVAKTTRTFDDMQRLVSVNDALSETTQYQYDDAHSQIIITRPNGRQEIQQYSDAGLIAAEQQKVVINGTEQQRTATYERDTGGRIVANHQPDGRITYTFYDCQQRLGFTVSATGIVAQYIYSQNFRYQEKRHYAKQIDFQILRPFPELLPDVSSLMMALDKVKDPASDRSRYTFFDEQGRVRYRVDEDGYVIEQRYQRTDHVSIKIQYAMKITAAQLDTFKQGQAITLAFNPNEDRCQRYFYNLDKRLMAEQDGAGYVTEYLRDAGGRLAKKIVYATKTTPNPLESDFSKLRPQAASDDAYTYYFRDARGQCVCEVDAEGYITSHTYLACGLKAQSIRYAQKVASSWYQDTRIAPSLPTPSAKDQLTVYDYDMLKREINRKAPLSTGITTQYDSMGHVTYQHTQDLLNPTSTDPSLQRSVHARFDGWEQKIAETNPFMAQSLFEIDSDPALSPEQKAEQKEQLWQDQSIRHVFDMTGLELKTLNALGLATYHYYDQERRPVLSIDPTGMVMKTTYNNFHEKETLRELAKPIPAETLKALTGGLITAEVVQLIEGLQSDDDLITSHKHDKRGHVTETIDPAGYKSIQAFNAFNQCASESHPVASTDPALTIQHAYEGRGLEMRTTQQVKDEETVTTARTYDNPYGKPTTVTDACGHQTTATFDKLGRSKAIINAQGVTIQTLTHDAFHRVASATDAAGKITQHSYDDSRRTHTVVPPVACTQTITSCNVFGKTLVKEDALHHQTKYTYAPDGQMATTTDALSHTTTQRFNRMGWLLERQTPDGTKTQFTYDLVGREIIKTEDADGKALKTKSFRDSFGRITENVNPRNVHTRRQLDKRHRIIKTVVDPTQENYQGLNLTTAYTYNGQDKVTSVMQGDAANPNQYLETQQYDDFGRHSGKTIDPNTEQTTGLAIQTKKQRDKAGHVVALVDANGKLKRRFFDALNQLRFEVDAEGGVTEWDYYATGKQRYQRCYTQKFDLAQVTDKTTYQDLMIQAKAKARSDDSLRYSFYNDNQRECFMVNGEGAVEEKRYNAASYQVKTIVYATELDKAAIASQTFESLTRFAKDQAQPSKDRITYHIVDAVGQERFIIDPKKALVEQCFDSRGRIYKEIAYGTWVEEAEALSQKSLADISAVVAQFANLEKDRVTYHVFDSLGRPEFTVNPEGKVTGFYYNENGKDCGQFELSQKLATIPTDYEALVHYLRTLKPDEKADRITKKRRDAADRVDQTTDALGNSDTFKLNALDEVEVHTDRAGNVWQYRYDRAKRKVLETAPETNFGISALQSDSKPIVMPLKVASEKETQYDKASNPLKVIENRNTPTARTYESSYSNTNRLIGTTITKVAIDDPSKLASLTERPEQVVNLTTKVIRNGKGLEIVSCDEAGRGTFSIYNSEGKRLYLIKPNKAVIKTEYNAFGEVSKQTCFANKLNIDISQYLETGIPREVVEDAHNLAPSVDDRVTMFERDQRGDVLNQLQGPVFFYVAAEKQFYSGLDYKQTKFGYNLFRDKIYVAKLINAKTSEWAEHFYWPDKLGKYLALCDANNYLKRYTRDAYEQVEKLVEFGVKLKQKPIFDEKQQTLDLSVADLDTLKKIAPLDRTYRFEYNLNGNEILKALTRFAPQQLLLNQQNIPAFQNLQPTEVIERKQYNAVGQKIVTIYADGSEVYRYYDALGNKIAETEVARNNGEGARLIPLTYYMYSPSRQQVLIKRFKLGTANPVINIIPVPVGQSLEDQSTITCHNQLDLPIWRANPEGVLKIITYNAARKMAREYSSLRYWLQNGTANGLAFHLDEKRFSYDELDNVTRLQTLRDNTIQDQVFSHYSTFGENISEGRRDGSWPVFWCYDNLGHIWLSNAGEGKPTLMLRDLRGKETLKGQSAAIDLATVSAQKLPDILALDPKKLERSESLYDPEGNAIIRFGVAYYQGGVWQRPIYRSEYDAWKNETKNINSRGNITEKSYNSLNKLWQTVKPKVKAIQPDGSVQEKTPIETYAFNIRGFCIGKIDENNHITGYVINKAGQQLSRVLADGVVELRQVYDALGRSIKEIDSRGATWLLEYNRLDKLTSKITPSGRRTQYGYNETNDRNLTIDAVGNVWRYNFDVFGNIKWRIQPNGKWTQQVADWRHLLNELVWPDGGRQKWQRDYFGYPDTYEDLSGVVTKYQRDYKKQVVQQTSQNAERHGNTLQLTSVTQEQHNAKFLIFDIPPLTLPFYGLSQAVMPNQNLTLVITGGRLSQVKDKVTGITHEYEYDTEGQTTVMRLYANGQKFYSSTTTYDALNRELESHAVQNGLHFQYTAAYDLVGNRRHEWHWLGTIAGVGLLSKDSWFDFDTANRVTLINQYNDASHYSRLRFGYTSGFRTLEQYEVVAGQQGIPLPHFLHYDLEGRLITVEVEYQDASTRYQPVRKQVAAYNYHLAGWLQKTNTLLRYGVLIFGPVEIWKSAFLNCTNDGKVLVDQKPGATDVITTTSFLPNGMPLAQIHKWQFSKKEGDETTTVTVTDDLTNHYIPIGGDYQLSTIEGQRTQSDGYAKYNLSQVLYDANNNINGVIQWDCPYYSYPGNSYHRLALFQNTYDGLIITKSMFDAHGCSGSNFSPTYDNAWEYLFYSANGRYIGGNLLGKLEINRTSESSGGMSRRYSSWWMKYSNANGSWDIYKDCASDLNKLLGKLDNGQPILLDVNKEPFSFRAVSWGEAFPRELDIPEVIYPIGANPSNQGLSSASIMPVVNLDGANDNFRPVAPRYYVPKENGSPIAVARSLNGTTRLAVAIAKANDFRLSETIKMGYELFIPEIHSNYNQQDDYKPYSRVKAAIIGCVLPCLTIIEPPQEDDDNFFKEALTVFVPICVGLLLGPAGLGIVSSLNVVVATAATNAITQGVMIGLGLQQQFSLMSMLESTITVGIGQALGPMQGLALKAIGERLVTYGFANAMLQMGEIEVGLKDKFDVGAMLHSAVVNTATDYLVSQANEKGHLTTGDKISLVSKQILVSDISAWALTGAPLKADLVAGQLTGAAAGMGLQGAAEIRTRVKEVPVSEEHQTAQQASKGQSSNSYASSNQAARRSPRLFDDPKLAEAKAWADADIEFDTDIHLDAAQKAYRDYTNTTDANVGRAARWQSQTAKTRENILSEHGSTIMERIAENFHEEITNPKTVAGALLEYSGERVEQLGLVSKFNRYEGYAKAGAHRVVENIADTVKSNTMYQRYSGLAAKYGFYAKGAEFIEGAGKLVLPVEILEGAVTVGEAKEGTRVQTLFEESGKIIGGMAGATLGIATGIAEIIPTGGLAIPVAAVGVVIDTSAGAALGKEFGRDLYIFAEKETTEFERRLDL